MAHAGRSFALSAPADDSGKSYRETLEGLLDRAYKSGRDRSKDIARWGAELECPPLPMALAYLWTSYNRIRRRKGGNGFGPCPLEGPDFESYERRYRMRFLPFENEILDELDDLFMRSQGGNTLVED